MISEKELQELVDFRTEESSVLSLYLNVDPTQHTKDEYRLTLKSMLKGVANEASAKDLAEVGKNTLTFNTTGKEREWPSSRV
jgi:hypothetical protein